MGIFELGPSVIVQRIWGSRTKRTTNQDLCAEMKMNLMQHLFTGLG